MIYYLRCAECNEVLQESKIQESHDIPCYLFEGNRKGQKNQADKFKRRHLCEKCHKKYEKELRVWLQKKAERFGGIYFA
jgi:hypothetical protein